MGNSTSLGSFTTTLYGYDKSTYEQEPCAECNDRAKYDCKFSCDECKPRPEEVPVPYTSEIVPTYEIIKVKHELLLQTVPQKWNNGEKLNGYAKWNLNNFHISFEEGAIRLLAKPERKLYYTNKERVQIIYDHYGIGAKRRYYPVSDNYRIVGISLDLYDVSGEESRKLEEELRKPEYGLNISPKKADDRVVPKKTEDRLESRGSLKVLESISDEGGIPDAGHRRLAAPSPVTVEAPDTSSFTAYTLLFSGILFAGFLLTKCLRKRNRHRRSFTREDEGAL